MLARSIVSLSPLLIIISRTAFCPSSCSSWFSPKNHMQTIVAFQYFFHKAGLEKILITRTRLPKAENQDLAMVFLQSFVHKNRHFHSLMVALAVRVLNILHICLDIVA
jgi:hypothetical protein